MSNKNNVFDHIFYEFQMYLDTYELLSYGEISICSKGTPPNQQFGFNLTFEGHQHYARNSIEFFSHNEKKDDDLRYHKILSDKVCVDLDYNLNKIKGDKYVDEHIGNIMDMFNKGVSHLTGYRTKSELADKTLTAIKDLFNGNKDIIRLPKKICDFLNLLEPINLVPIFTIKIDGVPLYHHLLFELADDEIQKRLISLKDSLSRLEIC